MTRLKRAMHLGFYAALLWWATTGIVLADPLDDAGAKLGTFLQRAGLVVSGLIPAVAGLAVGGLAIKRAAAKTMGEEESMVRTSNQIVEVLKLTAIGTGASVLVSIAGSVLK